MKTLKSTQKGRMSLVRLLRKATPLSFLRAKRTCLGCGSLWYSWLLQQ
ncbi:rCG28324, isoform CRA_c [Rattus norvegicus]|uniref:RCG28324, isoform CRA_c n=1 Tax=Rattus norvegicus TaxID=10116 RepID=A6IED2_RAT|nr:rCG28324, isoform CRA_c [Rattus norvegicus]